MGDNVLFREANQPNIAHHIDIGFGAVQRDQFGSLANAKPRGINPRRLAPDVMDRSESVKKQLSDDDRFLAAVAPRSSSKGRNNERCSLNDGGALVEFLGPDIG